MELERNVTEAFQKAKKYAFENRRLTLKDSDGRELRVLLKVD